MDRNDSFALSQHTEGGGTYDTEKEATMDLLMLLMSIFNMCWWRCEDKASVE